MRRVNDEVWELVQDALHSARVREIGSVVAAVHDERHAALDQLVDAHESIVVHVHLLRVGMELHPSKSQANRTFDFGLWIGIVLMHRHEADEVGVLFAFCRDEVVDGLDVGRLRRHRIDDVMRDGRALHSGEHCGDGPLLEHGVLVEVAHAFSGAECDFLRIYVNVGIDDGHGVESSF